MKKRYIIVLILLLILVILYNNKKELYRLYIKYDIEQDAVKLLNDLNFKTKYFEKSRKWLLYATTETINKYDISDVLKEYSDKVNSCYLKKKYNMQFEEKDYRRGVFYSELNNQIQLTYMPNAIYDYIIDNITEEQIENYEPEKLKNELTEEFRKLFLYENDKWYIYSDKSQRIELPYNVYIDYKADDKVLKNNISKFTSMKIDCKLDEILSENERDYPVKNIILKYIDNNGNKQVSNGDMYINRNKVNGKYVYSYVLDIQELFYTQSQSAEIRFGQHDYDNWREERIRFEKEEIKRQESIDPSTIVVDTQIKRIKEFQKYNEFNNHNQFASIIVETYKDGSKKSFFRKFIVFDDETGIHIKEEYMKRELPYKNKSIDEVMELYINDKEQYSIDEELLKNGNALVEFESYTRP